MSQLGKTFASFMLLALAAAVCGCAGGTPRIDPSGDRLFTWTPPPSAVPATYPPPGQTPSIAPALPAGSVPAYSVPAGTVPAIPTPATTTPVAAAPLPAAPAVSQPGLTLTPGRIVAPVGTEVLLVAGVHEPGEPMVPYRRVEWLLAPGSVGQFLGIGDSDRLFGGYVFGTRPTKINNEYAVNETLAVPRVLNRGTPDPNDDVSILAGQAWITVSSPVEGASYATAYAPEIQGTQGNRQSSVVHWVDARWTAPPSTSLPVGGKLLMQTRVTRQTTAGPAPGYKVRYEVVGGPPAVFVASNSSSIEVNTDESGQANVELAQVSAEPGINSVSVTLERPAGLIARVPDPLVLGATQTQVTWLAPGSPPPAAIAPPGPSTVQPASPATPGASAISPPTSTGPLSIKIDGPQAAAVGETVRFTIEIANRGAQPATGLEILDRFDQGLRHSKFSGEIKKKLDDLPPGQSVSVAVSFQVASAGRHCHTVRVSGDGGLSAEAQACLTATATAEQSAPSISLNMTGPRVGMVGQMIRFRIDIKNTSQVPIPRLTIECSPDAELIPRAASESPPPKQNGTRVTWNTESPLPPGKSLTIEMECECSQVTGSACNRVKVTDGAQITVADEVCLRIDPAQASRGLRLQISDDSDPASLGRAVNYQFVVANETTAVQKQVKLSVALPPGAKLTRANVPVKYAVAGNRLVFEPVLEIPAGRSVQYALELTFDLAGKNEVLAEVVSTSDPVPVTARESTYINPAGQ